MIEDADGNQVSIARAAGATLAALILRWAEAGHPGTTTPCAERTTP